MTAKDPRHGYEYQKKRAAFIKAAGNGTPCHLCGHPVDTSLPGTHPAGPTIEHTTAVRHAPELALDVTLWALAHSRCQSRQGARAVNRGDQRQPNVARPRPAWIRWERQWFDGGPYIPPGK